jgi:hypothetical protein
MWVLLVRASSAQPQPPGEGPERLDGSRAEPEPNRHGLKFASQGIGDHGGLHSRSMNAASTRSLPL